MSKRTFERLSVLIFLCTIAFAASVPAAGFEEVFAATDSTTQDAFSRGQDALNDKRWTEAANIFEDIADRGEGDVAAAIYWLAYAQSRAKHYRAAQDTLEWLLDGYPHSRWAEDGRALDIEIRGRLGEALTPEEEASEELKLYALDGLMHNDSEKAIPILERFLAGDHSIRLKEHALFVLSQSSNPRAREILRQTARGTTGDLQVRAIEVIGFDAGGEDLDFLADIYRNSPDPQVKSAVLESFLVSERTDRILELARTETDPELREQAVETLGALRAVEDLQALYASAQSNREKASILQAYAISGETELLLQAARGESDPELRSQAIEGLAISDARGSETANLLLELYGEVQTRHEKEAIIEALMIQDAADALIQVYRSESDVELRREAIEALSHMDSEAVTELLLEILDEN